jgi:mannose-1-phosphate guanylyltransferase/phosphomannomutase
MELTVRAELSLDQAFATLPRNYYHHLELSCPWESKGGLMRRMSEYAVDQRASFTDGVRIDTDQGWVLVLPDQHRPIAHIYVEATEEDTANELRELYRGKVSGWLAELAEANPS